jgi:hypothetical protein
LNRYHDWRLVLATPFLGCLEVLICITPAAPQ